MDFNVTVNIPALDRLVDVLKAGVSLPAVAASSATPKADSKQKAQPAVDAAVEQVKTKEPVATKEEPEPEATTAEADLNTVKAKAMELSQKKGRDELVKTLSEYGATNISGLPADQFAAFIANVEGKLAA